MLVNMSNRSMRQTYTVNIIIVWDNSSGISNTIWLNTSIKHCNIMDISLNIKNVTARSKKLTRQAVKLTMTDIPMRHKSFYRISLSNKYSSNTCLLEPFLPSIPPPLPLFHWIKLHVYELAGNIVYMDVLLCSDFDVLTMMG